MKTFLAALMAFGLVGPSLAGAQSIDRNALVADVAQAKAKLTTLELWHARRAQLRETFLRGAGLWPMPEKTPLAPKIFARRQYDGYSVENVALETFPGFYCTGNLYRPTGPGAPSQQRPGPAILCPHGHFRDGGRMRPDQQLRCAHLARQGATVFSYSMVGWQDSLQTTHDDPLVLTLQTWNSIRALDFLCELPEVDRRRIGATGASGGGTQTFFLAAIDERVAASAPVAIVYPWAPPGCCLCEGQGREIFSPAGTNAIEFSALVAPRPQLFISVGGDDTRDFPQVGLPLLKSLYGLYGHSQRVESVHLADEGHDFGASKRKAVYSFFARYLGTGDAPEDRDRIVLETEQQMQVFSGPEALPPGALLGEEAIGKAFAALKRQPAAPVAALEGEELFFTPAGRQAPGQPVTLESPAAPRLKITVVDQATGKPTPCRINVVGPDGNYYQPAPDRLSPYALTGQWPNKGAWGNREGKSPHRYLGRFFYSSGESVVAAPAGAARMEVSKGFEFRPVAVEVQTRAGETVEVNISLARTLAMQPLGWWGGDMHLHIPRASEEDDALIFDLLEAEDIAFGSLLAYNEPAGPYAGKMDTLASPQFRGLGRRSLARRGDIHLMSGQEYRNATFGHLLLFQRDDLVFPGEAFNADLWPVYGLVGQQTQALGGYAFYAHGGYRQEIYADAALGAVNGVELLQFGIYRELGLADWYDMQSAGYRFPCIGASDWPACRWLGDCRTYARIDGPPDFSKYLEAIAKGRSFATTGPMLLLEVAGRGPGDHLPLSGAGPHKLHCKITVGSEAAPVQFVDLIVNGQVERTFRLDRSPGRSQSPWSEFSAEVTIHSSSWIAARAWGATAGGRPDAEAHTNSVFAVVDGRMPYSQAALDRWLARIDEQIARHRQRDFSEKARVLDYFQSARDRLLAVRQRQGLKVDENPADLAAADGETSPLLEDASLADPSAEELRKFLKPTPPSEPAEALKSFETAAGFEMQLVAAEPLVVDPIAAAFDEDGALYVCEMRDYPFKPAEGKSPIGTVRLLRDRDGDGVFDQSTVFAEELLWAAGVAPWKGGVFIAAAPDIWYFRDEDGDGRADTKTKVFTGFGTDNQQAMVNNLVWGLDGKIYGATAGNGGRIVRPDRAGEPPVDLGGRDFRFDPQTLEIEPVTGTIQFGNTFDDWGNRFVCSESRPMLHVLLPLEYTSRNPFLSPGEAIRSIAPTPTGVHRISPIERWRQIRSSRRIAKGERSADAPGASHHVIDAAAGLTIYRGGAFPSEYYGSAFLGDGQNNLVHRRVLAPDGVSFTTSRGEPNSEFVRSSDIWFRPVNFVNAPDGTLYCLDMSREYLESIHIPLDVAALLDLTSGRDRGRIYRLAPAGFRSPPPPRYSQAGGEELVAALESPHGWHRDTAMRLIRERRPAEIAEPLRRLAASSPSAATRVAALWSLASLDALGEQELLRGLADSHPGVRENSLRLAERRFADFPSLRQAAIGLTNDDNPRVRFQAAFSLGQTDDPAAADALIELLKREGGDGPMRTAVLSSMAPAAATMFARLADDRSFVSQETSAAILEQLAMLAAVSRSSDEAPQVLAAIAQSPAIGRRSPLESRLLLALGERLRRSGRSLWAIAAAAGASAQQLIEDRLRTAESLVADSAADEGARVAALRMLACGDAAVCRRRCGELLEENSAPALQAAAIAALKDLPGAESAELIVGAWPHYGPAAVEAAIDAALASEEGCLALLEAMTSQPTIGAALDAGRRQTLRIHPNAKIRELAARRLPEVSSGREAVLADYRSAIAGLTGDIQQGEKVFVRTCANCHQLDGKGHAVGPLLSATALRDRDALLTHILDPNRYVAPSYLQYAVVDRRGRIYSGMLAAQSPASVTLKREKDAADTILQSDIEELSPLGKSLMPEGLEKEIAPQAMADLLAWLGQAADKAASEGDDRRQRDFGTLPGLIEQ